MKPIVFSASAAQDLTRALDYSATIEPAAATRFWAVLEAQLSIIRAFPGSCAVINADHQVRKVTLTRIPYSVYHIESTDWIMVIALLHHRRDVDTIIQ